MTADDVIRILDLSPHPEGGHYREVFRDQAVSADGRAASTAIYFLLAAGEISRWHRVDASETWLWHAGAPLELSVADSSGKVARNVIGADLGVGQRPMAVVPALAWQQAESLGDWTLVSCVVAPGFTFEGFELAPEGFDPFAGWSS